MSTQSADSFSLTEEASRSSTRSESDRETPQNIDSTRLSLRLSPQARAAVEEIMKIGNIETMQEAIRRAISDELFLMKERNDGWQVLLKKEGRYREVVWPDR